MDIGLNIFFFFCFFILFYDSYVTFLKFVLWKGWRHFLPRVQWGPKIVLYCNSTLMMG